MQFILYFLKNVNEIKKEPAKVRGLRVEFTVAMALFQALEHQKNAALALVKARSGTADVMVQTSQLVKESATSVSEMYFNPAAELAKIEAAHNNLMSALQTLENASRTGIVTARQSAEKLKSMTLELRGKQEQLRSSHALAESTS